MYLRPNRRIGNGETYESWTLVERVRTARGPRQRIVATLGKLAGLDREARMGWERIGEILDGRAHQADFLSEAEPAAPEWASVDVSRVSVERLRRFGEVYLGLRLWRQLNLDSFFHGVMERGREEVPWPVMGRASSLATCILTLGRFCERCSELRLAESWYGQTALDDLLGVGWPKVNEDRLYRALDQVLPRRDELFRHLRRMYGQMFGTTFDFLLCDVTSTHFEGAAAGNAQAKRGYSRDGRPDCPQVCIALVVTPQGLPIGYEVFDGNRAEVTTVQEMVAAMEAKYGQARRAWVMDRGMVSEDNLRWLRERKAWYLVGTPKSLLRPLGANGASSNAS